MMAVQVETIRIEKDGENDDRQLQASFPLMDLENYWCGIKQNQIQWMHQ